MNHDLGQAVNPAESQGSLLVLALLAFPAGAAAGLVGALFRLALERANELRDVLIARAQGADLGGLLLVVLTCSALALVAACLVRRFSPYASGSGIPHVEAVLQGQLYPSYGLVLVKFVGGILAIGSGLALGRVGPCVQMGPRLGYLAGHLCRRSTADCRVLFAAGAGAGLATAFNAPFAGALFVLEELVQVMDRRIAIAALRHRRRRSSSRACCSAALQTFICTCLPIRQSSLPGPKSRSQPGARSRPPGHWEDRRIRLHAAHCAP